MRLVFGGVLFLLTVSQTHQKENVTRRAEAFAEVRESLRHLSPEALLRQSSDALSSVLPKEMIFFQTDQLKELAKNIVTNATNPKNLNTLLGYVKQSDVEKKAELIRMLFRFLNPDNLTPEALINTFKTMEPHTVTELSKIIVKYLKFLEPYIFGHDYDGLLKYVNEPDLAAMTNVLFGIFQETNATDLIWLTQRVQNETNDLQKMAKVLIKSEGDVLWKNWQKYGEELKEKVAKGIKDVKRVGRFEKFSAKGKQLTETFKTIVLHFFDNFFNDLKNLTAGVDGAAFEEKLTQTVKQTTDEISGFLNIYDFDEIGTDVERAMDYVKSLNASTALAGLELLINFAHPVEKLVDHINESQVLNASVKSKFVNIVSQLNHTLFSHKFSELFMNILLNQVHHLDGKWVRKLAEFLVKEYQINNDVYSVFKAIAANLVKDGNKQLALFLSGKSFDNLKAKVDQSVRSIDGKLVEDFMREFVANLQHLNASDVVKVLAAANHLIENAFTDDFLFHVLDTPHNFFKILNHAVFADFVYLLLDLLKLINVEDYSTFCRNVSLIVAPDLKETLINTTEWVEEQFKKVENGSIVAKKLHIDGISTFFLQFFGNTRLKVICGDLSDVLRLNRALQPAAREELVELLWNGLQSARNKPTAGIFDQDVMNSLVRVLAQTERDRPDDARVGVLRVLARQIRDITQNGLLFRDSVFDDVDDEPGLLTQFNKFVVKASTPIPETTTTTASTTTTTTKPTATTTSTKPTSTTTPTKTTSTTTSTTLKQVSSVSINTTEEPTTIPELPKKFEYLLMAEDDSDCKKQINVLFKTFQGADVAPEQLWAVKMLDSWTPSMKIHPVVFANKRRECLSIKKPEAISGQFCTSARPLRLKLNSSDTSSQVRAVCIPTSCSISEWNSIVRAVFWREAVIEKGVCANEIESGPKTMQQGFWILLAVSAVLITSCSVYELSCTSNDPSAIGSSFSLFTTFRRLLGPSPDEWPMGIDGMRVLALAYVALHNTLEFSVPILNESFGGKFSREYRYVAPMNVDHAYDALLFTSGLLLARSFLTALKTEKRFDVIYEPLKQALNWITCLLTFMLLRSGLLRSEESEEPVCKSLWWHHILFFSNFMNVDYSCLPQGWYLSLEMQLFVFSVFILFILYFGKKLRWIISLVLLIAFTCGTSAILFYTETKTIYPRYGDDQFWADSVKPYTRAVAWIVGIITGFVIFKQSDYDFQLKMTSFKAVIAMILSLALCFGCVAAASAFLVPYSGKWQLPTYIALSRLGFSIGLSAIIILCVSGNGGWFAKFLSADVFKVLNRLFVSTFLSLFIVINLRLKHYPGLFMDDYSLVLAFFADLVVSYLLGFVLYVFFEGPVTYLLQKFAIAICPLPRKTLVQRDEIPSE